MSRPRFALLLGAGSSFEAGLPLLDGLTNQVASRLPADLTLVFDALRVHSPERAAWPGESELRNIEDILSASDALAAARFVWGGYGPREFALLSHEVRKRIWAILSRKALELSYLDGLENLIDREAGLRIFSLNNDLVIETWAKRQRLALFAGFDAVGRFAPDEFATDLSPIHLTKIHGSIDWSYQGGQLGRFSGALRVGRGQLPLRSPLPELAVVFPSRTKILTQRPLGRLFEVFRRALDEIDLLAVIGCQLADAHVFSALAEAIRSRPSLRVLVVSPDPAELLARMSSNGELRGVRPRIDILPMGFGESLRGPLGEAIERGRRGETSLGGRIVRWGLTGNREEEGGDRVPSLREIAQGERLLASFEEGATALSGGHHDLFRQARQYLAGAVSPLAVGGDLQALWTASSSPLREASRHVLAGTSNGVYALVGRRRSRIARIGAEGSWELCGPKFRSAGGLAVLGERAFVVQRSIGPFEGLGLLWEVDLRTGRRQARRIQRGSNSLAREIGTSIREAVRALRRSEPQALAEVKLALLAVGLLNFPSVVRVVGSDRLALLESRRVMLLGLPDLEIRTTSPETFLNLDDIAYLENSWYVLLEGGLEREGALWLWHEITGEVRRFPQPLRGAGGLFFDASRRRILLTVDRPAPRGEIWEIPLGDAGESDRERPPTRLTAGLHRPSYLTPGSPGTWYVATASGIVRFLENSVTNG